MARFTIRGQVDGVAEVNATLAGLPGKLARSIMRPALSQATKPTLAAAKRRAVRNSGLLRRSLIRVVRTYKRDDEALLVVLIGPRRGMKQRVVHRGSRKEVLEDPANIAHLVEFGTRPHSILKGAKRAKLEGAKSSTLGMHPGAKAQPFVRPAYDETRGQVSTIYGQRVLAGLEKELAKRS